MTGLNITKDDVVYISGPMTGKPNANREAFDTAEKALVAVYGCRVINPAKGLPDGLQYRQYMAHALQLLSCATAIFMLPGHEDSAGATMELICAQHDGLKSFLPDEGVKE